MMMLTITINEKGGKTDQQATDHDHQGDVMQPGLGALAAGHRW
jgi:hypothetical protein